MTNPICDKKGCGLPMIKVCVLYSCGGDCYDPRHNETARCERNDDAHALCAKLAESEAKVAELEAKLAEAQGALVAAWDAWNRHSLFMPEFATKLAREVRIEARKKGAEHE